VTHVIDAAIADVRPERCAFLHQADRGGGARPRVDRLAVAELRHIVVRPAQSHVEKSERIEQRERCLAERFEQALQCSVRSAAAVGVTAHAVDDDQQSGLLLRGDGDAVLVVFAVSDETQLCILDPQAGSGARPVCCYTSTPRRSAGRGALYHRANTRVRQRLP
jgi:hypothetical protein